MSEHISVITPVIDASDENHFNRFNLLLDDDENHSRIMPVSYSDSNKYVIIYEDENRPNIVIDDETLDALKKAYYRKNVMETVIRYLKSNPHISNKILNSANILAEITMRISCEIISDEYLEQLCKEIPEIQKYMI